MSNPHEDVIRALEEAFVDASPTIVNEDSKFIIATYWWGRGNRNNNTSKYCHATYEQFVKQIEKACVNIYNGSMQTNPDMFYKVKNGDFMPYSEIRSNLQKICKKFSIIFYNSLKSDIVDEINLQKLDSAEKGNADKSEYVLEFLDDLKKRITSSIVNKSDNLDKILRDTFIYENKFSFMKLVFDNHQQSKKRIQDILEILSIIIYNRIKGFLTEYSKILISKNMFRMKVEQLLSGGMDQTEIVSVVTKMAKRQNAIKKAINSIFKKKLNLSYEDLDKHEKYEFESILRNNNLTNEDIELLRNDSKIEANIYDILNTFFRWKLPILYNEMIDKWEAECAESKCNYFALEVPAFAKKGGYQMAINAKPYFIQKALAKSGGRAIVYIDGDMFVRKYPHIFDTENVDFMARGWWSDPRAADNYQDSAGVMMDPYMFETSGGIMYFADSNKSKQLLKYWIDDTQKPRNDGKADDRILSLTFNVRKLLLDITSIQLPIEYLWLTINYSPRAMEKMYDWDFGMVRKSVIIEHPECLTTEDTATGAGASSDRQPKYYDFIEDLKPISELLHEDVFIQSDLMKSELKPYFDYFKHECYYINDIDEAPDSNIWIDNGMIRKEGYNSVETKYFNKKPFTFFGKEDEYQGEYEYNGNTIFISDVQKYNREKCLEIKERKINSGIEENKFDNDSLNIIHLAEDYVEENIRINDPLKRGLIPRIISHLKDNKDVIWYPSGTNYNMIETLYNETNLDYDFQFTPISDELYDTIADYYKVGIDLTKPILFLKPYKGYDINEMQRYVENSILIKFLMMHEYLEQISNTLRNGSYQFVSRLRIKYINPANKTKSDKEQSGTIGALRNHHFPPGSIEQDLYYSRIQEQAIELPRNTTSANLQPNGKLFRNIVNEYTYLQSTMDDSAAPNESDDEIAEILGQETTASTSQIELEDDDSFEETDAQNNISTFVGGRSTPSPVNSPLTIPSNLDQRRSKTPDSLVPIIQDDAHSIFQAELKAYMREMDMESIIEETIEILSEMKENERE